MRETTELFLKASPENLARLGELLVHAYQEEPWPTTGLQKVKIFFEENDVTMYQLCDGQEAISYNVLAEERAAVDEATAEPIASFNLLQDCLDAGVKQSEIKYPDYREMHHTQLCIQVTKQWDNHLQKRLDKRRYSILRDEWYCYPASDTLAGAFQNMLTEEAKCKSPT